MPHTTHELTLVWLRAKGHLGRPPEGLDVLYRVSNTNVITRRRRLHTRIVIPARVSAQARIERSKIAFDESDESDESELGLRGKVESRQGNPR